MFFFYGRGRWALPVIVLTVLGIAYLPPVVQGYHIGCNVSAGDNVKMTRLGIQFCKQVPPDQVPGAVDDSPDTPPPVQATSTVDASQYGSPCSLYLEGHDVSITFSGSGAASDCASFVQNEGSDGTWTTQIQNPDADLTQVCSLSNGGGDTVAIQDDGGQDYGNQACSYLENNGWSGSASTGG